MINPKIFKLNKKYIDEINDNASDIILHPEYQKNKEYIQHGKVSIYEHCIMVTIQCLKIADIFNLNFFERRKLIRAALLHDYFKYDWHNYAKENGLNKLHGIYHPGYAAENAKKDFNIDKIEENCIRSHMWPLGFEFPKSKAAWILFMSDKISALSETITMRK